MVSQIVLCCLFAAQAMLRYGAFDVSFPKKIDYDHHARRPRDHHAPKDGFKGAHWDRSRLSEVSESLISESAGHSSSWIDYRQFWLDYLPVCDSGNFHPALAAGRARD